MTNWPEYDAALVRRGSLTIWVTQEAMGVWHAPVTGKRGAHRVYSDIAIETGLALRLVLYQPLRQTEGALRSIADRLGGDIRDPEHTKFTRRSANLTILPKHIPRDEQLHLSSIALASKGGSCMSASTPIPTRLRPWTRPLMTRRRLDSSRSA
jgi:hypothetical protein